MVDRVQVWATFAGAKKKSSLSSCDWHSRLFRQSRYFMIVPKVSWLLGRNRLTGWLHLPPVCVSVIKVARTIRNIYCQIVMQSVSKHVHGCTYSFSTWCNYDKNMWPSIDWRYVCVCVCVCVCSMMQWRCRAASRKQLRPPINRYPGMGDACVGEGVLYYCKYVYYWCMSNCVNKCEREWQWDWALLHMQRGKSLSWRMVAAAGEMNGCMCVLTSWCSTCVLQSQRIQQRSTPTVDRCPERVCVC